MHPLFRALGADPTARQAAYRALFRAELDSAAVDHIRLAAQQSQPLGDRRFEAQIARALGDRRAPRPRGRPARPEGTTPADDLRQNTLEF